VDLYTGLPLVWKTWKCKGKKVKEVDLYSAFIVVPHTEGAQVWISVLPANYTIPTDVQAAAEDSAVRPLLPLTVLLRPFPSVFCLTLTLYIALLL